MKDISELIAYNMDGSALILRDMIDKYLNNYNFSFDVDYDLYGSVNIKVMDINGNFVDTIRLSTYYVHHLDGFNLGVIENLINIRKRLHIIDELLNT